MIYAIRYSDEISLLILILSLLQGNRLNSDSGSSSVVLLTFHPGHPSWKEHYKIYCIILQLRDKWRRRSMMYSKKIHGNIPIASLTTTSIWVAITHGRRPEACAAAAAWTLFRLENLPNRSDHKNTPRSVDIGNGENVQQSQTAPSQTAQSSAQGSSWEHFRMALWCLCWFSLGLEEYRVSLISSLLHRSIDEVARCFAISIREEASHNTLEPSGHRMLPGGRPRRDWSDILLCRLYIPGRPHLIGANVSHNICYRRTNFVFNEVTSQPSCHIWAKQRLCLMTIQHN